MGWCTQIFPTPVSRPNALMLAPAALCAFTAQAAAAQDAEAIGRAFADNCFSPYLTAETAQETLARSGGRVDFYDQHPFSDVPPSLVTGRTVTPGTDRRCEVAFDGADTNGAEMWVITGLIQERLIDRVIDVPDDFPLLPTTQHAAAVQLNPARIAVTQVGTRPGPNGPETYMNVERLTPLSEGDS